MKKMLNLLIATLLCIGALSAQNFMPKVHNGIRYQVMENIGDGDVEPALVVYLHGGSGRGEDNRTQMNQTVADIAKYIRKNSVPALFLVPQCPSDCEWEGRDEGIGYTDRVEELVSYYLEAKNMDLNRIYICGVSMGACGVWRMLKDNPKMFTAAIIASRQPFQTSPTRFTEIPLYVTVGSEERSFEPLQWFTSAINRAGGLVKFDVLVGYRHREACDGAFTTKRLKWLFSQTKSAAANR